MVTIYNFKPKFQNTLRPISNWLACHGVSANQVTVSAIILSAVVGMLIVLFPSAKWAMLLVPVVLLVRMILNAIDGMIAREHNMQSALGTFLNELGDVLSDVFIYLPFSIVPNISGIFIEFIVLLAIISEMMGVVAIQVGTLRRYDGPMGKSDRAFVFGVIGLLLGLGYDVSGFINLVLLLILLALILTILKRITNALTQVRT